MKFKFRLETLIKQRKVEQDLAQRDFAIAAENLRIQLAKIKALFEMIDQSQIQVEKLQSISPVDLNEINQIHEFISGQKVRIKREREHARQLMSIEEEKHEILAEKMRNLKVLEKLKEKQKIEFKKAQQKKLNKSIDDLTTSRYQFKR